MMARSEGCATVGEDECRIWGTWEELLLACAVCRHGTSRWESVAMELGSRCSSAQLLTPERCRKRYHELRKRFEDAVTGGGAADDGDERDPDGEICGGAVVPWLDELRRIRVNELRREVERHDASIGSLQLKVNRLKEERERSHGKSGSSSGEQDLDRNGDKHRPGSCSSSPPGGDTAQPACGVVEQAEVASGGKPGAEAPDTANARDHDPAGVVRVGDEAEKAGAGEEGSFDGSSDTVSKGDQPQPAADGSPSPEVAGAVAAAAVGEVRVVEPEAATAKEVSDVQSSASPSRGRRPMATEEASTSASASASRAASSGFDEAEADDESPLRHRGVATAIKPSLLASLLETVRSSKYGSVFERRLPAQQGTRYQSFIRQHVDLETIQRRVEEASYSRLELHRDLLLLCNNAVVFFQKGSDEHAAALHLRGLISKKFASGPLDGKAAPIPGKPSNSAAVARQLAPPSKVKTEAATSSSLLEKPSVLPSLIACKKRSSITARATTSSEEKGEEKPSVVGKVTEGVGLKVEDKPVVRGLRTTKARGASGKTANQKLIKAAAGFGSKSIPPDSAAELPKAEKKTDIDATVGDALGSAQTAPAAKKKGVAVFLKRMKGPDGASSQKKAEPEQRKGGKIDERKEKAPRQGEVAKAVPNPSPPPPPKRKGRPPKRPALASSPQPPPAKKGRTADAEVPLQQPPRQRGPAIGKREKR